ncbi:MAG: TlyA family RNA methyltransferase [Bacteroidales bacterium]
MRLDKLLIQKNYFPSREKAQDAIIQKTVKVNGMIVDKPSKDIDETATIDLIDVFNKYVSRGGLKLEKAILDFHLDFTDKMVLDVGASTGGFSDCALKHGAQLVVAVDVGTNQLHPSLRQHPQIISIENRDFRELTPEEIENRKFDFIVSDVSFISLTYLFPYFRRFLKENGQLMLLIKPQFEAGTSFLNRSGIVVDEKGYKVAIQRVSTEALNNHFYLQNLSVSTLFERHKNVEFLALFSLTNQEFVIDYLSLFAEVKNKKNKVK